jgi:hypothetical protein
MKLQIRFAGVSLMNKIMKGNRLPVF